MNWLVFDPMFASLNLKILPKHPSREERPLGVPLPPLPHLRLLWGTLVLERGGSLCLPWLSKDGFFLACSTLFSHPNTKKIKYIINTIEFNLNSSIYSYFYCNNTQVLGFSKSKHFPLKWIRASQSTVHQNVHYYHFLKCLSHLKVKLKPHCDIFYNT